MASKFLFSSLFLALTLYFSSAWAAQLQGSGKLPVIHITNVLGRNNLPDISLRIKAGGKLKGSAELSPWREYQISVDVDDVYYATAVYGVKIASFHAYETGRDKGHADVYWRANKWGFAVSYDNTKWEMVALWKSE